MCYERKIYTLLVLSLTLFSVFEVNASDGWERIYFNDFGGNSTSDPQIGSALSPGETLWDYDFDETCRFGYCILKHFDNNRNWYQGGDHTHPDNKEMGYYLLFNPNSQNKEIAAYRTKLNDLCKGLKIRFSAYVANLVKPNMSGSSPSLYPRLSLGVYEGETPEVKVSEQAYDMLDVPVSPKEESDQTLDWQKISIEFTLEADMECAYFIVSMVRPESNGWDFAIDDISIEVAQPEVTISHDALVEGSPLTLMAHFNTDDLYLDNMASSWEYSADGQNFTSLASSAADDSDFSYTIGSFNRSQHSGYYRFKLERTCNPELGALSQICYIDQSVSAASNRADNPSFFEEGGFLHVQNTGESFSYNISSLTGKQMASGNTSNGLIPVSNLQPGVYFVTIDVNGESRVERIILTGSK